MYIYAYKYLCVIYFNINTDSINEEGITNVNVSLKQGWEIRSEWGLTEIC